MTFEEIQDVKEKAIRAAARGMGWNKYGKGKFAVYTFKDFIIEYRKGLGQDRAFQSRFNEDKSGWFLLQKRSDGLLSNLGRNNSVIEAQCCAFCILVKSNWHKNCNS